MAHADEERITIETNIGAHPHAEHVYLLRKAAKLHRTIAHELEYRARMIECHVECNGDPICCAARRV